MLTEFAGGACSDRFHSGCFIKFSIFVTLFQMIEVFFSTVVVRRVSI